MKSNQLTDKHLRGLSLLSNCKWPTSSLPSPSARPAVPSRTCCLSVCEPHPQPTCWKVNSSWSLLRSAWLAMIFKLSHEMSQMLASGLMNIMVHNCEGLTQASWLCSVSPDSSPMCSPFCPATMHDVCTRTCPLFIYTSRMSCGHDDSYAAKLKKHDT